MPLELSAPSATPEYLRILLHGNNATGKSITTLTASGDCPTWVTPLIAKPPADAQPVTLNDIAWVGVDHGALTGAAELKVRVPTYIDASKKPLNQVVPFLVGQLKELASLCDKGTIRAVVFDTVSKLDTLLDTLHAPLDDRTKIAAAKLRDHGKIAGALFPLKADVIILCHTKATFDMNEDAKKRREARGLPTYIPRIGGTALDIYQNDMDFIFSVQRKPVQVNGKMHEQIVWYTSTADDVQAKSRVQSIPKMMPADFRELRRMIADAGVVV